MLQDATSHCPGLGLDVGDAEGVMLGVLVGDRVGVAEGLLEGFDPVHPKPLSISQIRPR